MKILRVVSFFTVSAFILPLCLIGCGRYGVPLSPEVRAPRPVQKLEVTYIPPAVEVPGAPPSEVVITPGVKFVWDAPSQDIRGKELKEMGGYILYRKEIRERADLLNPEVPYEQITLIKDDHIIERDRLRKEARAAGMPGQRIQAPGELLHFEYLDTKVVLGTTYAYKIVPFNQGDVQGEYFQSIIVIPRSEKPFIAIIPSDVFGSDSPMGESGSGPLSVL